MLTPAVAPTRNDDKREVQSTETKGEKMMKIDELKIRLKTYPGPHENEKWKLERDLTKCTDREKREMSRYGVTVEDLMTAGLTRGEVSHIFFGYRFPRRTG